MDNIVQQVWEKAVKVDGINPDYLRKDFAGAWICREAYGTETMYGWEIDHIKPIEKGGGDNIDNLEPLHWQNNRYKSNDYPKFDTYITAQGNRNIEHLQIWNLEN